MQVFANKENFGALTKFSNTVVQLAPSVITIGAKQYTTGILDCDTATDLDTGVVQAYKKYYVYAVVELNNVILKASLSAIAPSGYAVSKLVSGFTTDGSLNITAVGTLNSDGTVTIAISSTITKLLSGSGTYNVPAGVVRLKITAVGAGGGGSGGSTNGANQQNYGVNGGVTTFSSFITANGGIRGGSYDYGYGGAASVSLPAIGMAFDGGGGGSNAGTESTSANQTTGGGAGGNSHFGGGGASRAATSAGGSGAPNSGGGGGGAGGTVIAYIDNPDSSYPYVIGAGGGGGSGASTGGTGADGIIIIEEFYQ